LGGREDGRNEGTKEGKELQSNKCQGLLATLVGRGKKGFFSANLPKEQSPADILVLDFWSPEL
jgi:hypothetical protein